MGWKAYTDNMTALELGYKNSLLVLAAYEGDELLGIIRVISDLLIRRSNRHGNQANTQRQLKTERLRAYGFL